MNKIIDDLFKIDGVIAEAVVNGGLLEKFFKKELVTEQELEDLRKIVQPRIEAIYKKLGMTSLSFARHIKNLICLKIKEHQVEIMGWTGDLETAVAISKEISEIKMKLAETRPVAFYREVLVSKN